jgi:hypothetical protein
MPSAKGIEITNYSSRPMELCQKITSKKKETVGKDANYKINADAERRHRDKLKAK